MPAVCNIGSKWTELGKGYCFQGGDTVEKTYRLTNKWVVADLATAKNACEANLQCVGLHYDATPGDYHLLSRLGTPNNEGAKERTCYKLRENPSKSAPATARPNVSRMVYGCATQRCSARGPALW